MSAPAAVAPPPVKLLSIGEVAELLETTTRTLRYYEELGLVSSSRLTETAQRRYGPAEIERLRRIRELQTLLGLELDEIAEHLGASDRLDGLRQEYESGPAPERRDEILLEGLAILERLRERVRDRQQGLATFAGELEARIGRYHAALDEHGVRAAQSTAR
ncbi:MAG: MerR family transcriptional regulator [Acidimicrobiales bacterium]|jgi:DNA-binding transcriptional MerR regulator